MNNIEKCYNKKSIGKILLINALKRNYDMSREIGSFAIVIYSTNKDAEYFYEKCDFIKLSDSEKTKTNYVFLKLLLTCLLPSIK